MAKSNTKAGTQQLTSAAFAPIESASDPRVPQALEFFNRFMENRKELERAEAERKVADDRRKSGLRLSDDQVRQIADMAEKIGMSMAAITRLSWLMDSGDHNHQSAGAMGLEALAMLNAWRSEAIAHALGHRAAGEYADELAVFARAYGYARRDAK